MQSLNHDLLVSLTCPRGYSEPEIRLWSTYSQDMSQDSQFGCKKGNITLENTYAPRIARHNAQVVVASKARNQVFTSESAFVLTGSRVGRHVSGGGHGHHFPKYCEQGNDGLGKITHRMSSSSTPRMRIRTWSPQVAPGISSSVSPNSAEIVMSSRLGCKHFGFSMAP